VPAGLKSYQTQLDYHSPDGSPLRVDVDANLGFADGGGNLDFPLGRSQYRGTADRSAAHGFLALDDADHNGMGFVNFSVKPKAGLPTGTLIDAQALHRLRCQRTRAD